MGTKEVVNVGKNIFDYTDKNNFGVNVKRLENNVIVTNGDTFQESFNVEGGGSLTFKNTNGDGYKLAVPSNGRINMIYRLMKNKIKREGLTEENKNLLDVYLLGKRITQ